MYLFEAVTNDEFELPIVVEESAINLAKTLGIKVDRIYAAIKKNSKCNGRYLGIKFLKINIGKSIYE